MEEQDNESDYDSELDSDDERTTPVPGGDLLQQIFHLQNVENANKLGIIQKTTSKPLMKKKAPANKLGQSQQASMQSRPQHANASKPTPSTTSSTKGRFEQEQDKLFRVVEAAFKAQILEDPVH